MSRKRRNPAQKPLKSAEPASNKPQELRKSWRYSYRIWWAMMWRMGLGLMLAMAVVVGYVDYYAYLPYETSQTIKTSTLIVLLPLGLWAVRAVVNRGFGDFRLVIVPLDATLPAKGKTRKKQDADTSTDHLASSQELAKSAVNQNQIEAGKEGVTGVAEDNVMHGDAKAVSTDAAPAGASAPSAGGHQKTEHKPMHATPSTHVAPQRKKSNKKRTKTKK